MKEIDKLIEYTKKLENKVQEHRIILANIKSQLEDEGKHQIIINGINCVLENGK